LHVVNFFLLFVFFIQGIFTFGGFYSRGNFVCCGIAVLHFDFQSFDSSTQRDTTIRFHVVVVIIVSSSRYGGRGDGVTPSETRGLRRRLRYLRLGGIVFVGGGHHGTGCLRWGVGVRRFFRHGVLEE
jgi:hypothetical protein